MYDSIIIGTGPAGLEAALNLKIRNKNFVLLGSKRLSRKIEKAPKIDNYLGMPGISGLEMVRQFSKHLKSMGIEITEQKAGMVYYTGSDYSVSTGDGILQAKTVILATGVFSAKMYSGEETFIGRGVGYCATCDAPLYKDKEVVIIGNSLESEHEANFMAEVASKVTFVPVAYKPTTLKEGIAVVKGKVLEIKGSLKANTLVLDTGEITAHGFFILRDNIAPTTLVPGIETQGAHIKVDSTMATNLPGCFAAGDCTGRPYQYIRSAGQGLTAAHSVVDYLVNK